MSSTITHCTYTRHRPEVIPTTTGRVKIRVEDFTMTLDMDHARSLMQDIESALLRLSIRDEPNYAD
jgi:hypothetical protein